MTVKHVPATLLAAALLAGTSGLALAQSSSQMPGSSKSPAAQSGSMNAAPQTEQKSRTSSPQSTTGQGSMEKGSMEKSSPNDQGTQASPARDKNSSMQSSPEQNNKAAEQSQTKPSSSSHSAKETSHPSGRNAQTGSQTGTQQRSTTAAAPANERVNLTSQQKTEIKTRIIDNKSAPRVSHVNFNVSVGTVVPTSIHLAPVPEVLISIHPAWKEYVYFVHEDEVIIINPRTHKIVEIVVVS